MKKAPVHLSKAYLLLCLCILTGAAVFLYVDFPTKRVNISSSDWNGDTCELKQRCMFVFDPNVVDSVALDSLRIPWQVKRNLIRFRTKGGHFRVKGDLKRLYGMSDSLFLEIAPFVDLPDSLIRKPKQFRTKYKARNSKYPFVGKPIVPIELNSASVDALKIHGLIGEKRAEAILSYRNKLGGFYSVSQLDDIYALPDSLLDTLQQRYFVQVDSIKKRNLSELDWKTLISYPWIDKFAAKHILQSQKISPEIRTIQDLYANRIIDSATFSVLQYYIN